MKISIPTWNLMQLVALEKVSVDDLLRKDKVKRWNWDMLFLSQDKRYISSIDCYLS